MWNYWDHEHITAMHEGFERVDVLYERGDVVVHLLTLKSPPFGWPKVRTLMFMRRESEERIVCCNTMLGMPVITTIDITEPEPDKSDYHMRYQFILLGWRRLFAPLFRWHLNRSVPLWNARQWREDLPIKLRRQKMLRAGFRDFKGLPDRIEDRRYDGPITCELPIARLKGSPVDPPDLRRK